MGESKGFDQILAGASTYRQIAFSSCLFMISISLGFASSLNSVLINEISRGTAGIVLPADQLSWMASLELLVAVPMFSIGGVIAEMFGRRSGALLICPLFIIGYSLTYFTTSNRSYVLFIARFFIGSANGLQHASLSSYFTEVASPQNRTAIHSFAGTWICCGLVLPLLLAVYDVRWDAICLVGMVFPVIGEFAIYFIPESPSWYVTKGKLKEARGSLLRLRGSDYPIEDELSYLMKSLAFVKQKQRTLRELCWRLLDPDVWKPIIIVNITFVLMIFCGISAIDRYVVVIFQASGTSVGRYQAALPVQAVRILAQLMGTYLLVTYPRKPIFVVSATLSALGLAGLGFSIVFNPSRSQNLFGDVTSVASEAVSAAVEALAVNSTTVPVIVDSGSTATWGWLLNYIPILSTCLVTFAFSFGLGPIPWAYGNELFPIDMRSELTGFTTSLVSLQTFAQVKCFPSVSSALGVGETFIMMGGVTFITAIWGTFYLPETKGKTLHQITRMFYSKEQLRRKRLESERSIANPE